jgi:hypothetical protein
MLIGVMLARTKIRASDVTTAAPPITRGTPAAISEPKTRTSATAASGRLTSSARRRSDSETVWMSP